MAASFIVLRGEQAFTAGSLTLTITEGVDYTLESGSNSTNTFIRLANTRHSGMGNNVGGGSQNADDYMVWIQNPGNIATSVTFERYGNANACHISWEIVQFVGAASSENEIIVRAQGEVNVASGSASGDASDVTTISNVNDCVVFITGQGSDSTTRNDIWTGLFTAELIDAGGGDYTPRFTRGSTASAGIGTVSYSVVEFTGSNWAVDRQEFTTTATAWSTGASTNNSTVTLSRTLSDITKAFIHLQYSTSNDPTGLDDAGDVVEITNTTTLTLRNKATNGTRTKVCWIVENTRNDDDGEDMIVSRDSWYDSNTAGPEPRTFTRTITTGSDLSNVSLFGSASTDGAGTAFPRGWLDYWPSATDTITFKESDTGQEDRYYVEVVQWPGESSGTDELGIIDLSAAATLGLNGSVEKGGTLDLSVAATVGFNGTVTGAASSVTDKVTPSRFLTPVSTGNDAQTNTNQGEKTTDGVLFIQTNAETNDTEAAHQIGGLGWSDGSSDESMNWVFEDNVASGGDNREAHTNSASINQLESNADTQGDVVATVNSLNTDGVTINYTALPATRAFVHSVTFADVANIGMGSATTNNTNTLVNVTGMGANDLIIGMINYADANSSYASDPAGIGIGLYDGTTQVSIYNASRDSGTVVTSASYVSTDEFLTMWTGSGTLTEGVGYGHVTASDLDSDGVSITPGAVTSMSWAAAEVSLFGVGFTDAQFKIGTFTTSGSTGNVATTGLGFEPGFVKLWVTSADTFDTWESTGDAGQLAIGTFTSDEEFCVNYRSEDAASTSNSGTRSVDKALFMRNGADSADLVDASFVSMDSDGWTLNYLTATALKGIYLAVEGGSASTEELGTLNLTSAATVTFTGSVERSASISINAVATLGLSGNKILAGTSSYSATATVTFNGLREVGGAVSFDAIADIAFNGEKGLLGSIIYASVADVTFNAEKEAAGSISLDAVANLSLNGEVTQAEVTGTLDISAVATVGFNGRLEKSTPISFDAVATVGLDGLRERSSTISFDATSNATFVGSREHSASITYASVANVSFNAEKGLEGSISFDAAGTLDINGRREVSTPLSLNAVADVTFNGSREIEGSVSFDATSAASFVGSKDLLASVSYSAISAVALAGSYSVEGAVSFDVVGSLGLNGSIEAAAPSPNNYVNLGPQGTGASVTQSYTVPSGDNRKLIVFTVGVDNDTESQSEITSVTFDGNSLTKVTGSDGFHTSGPSVHGAMWFLDNPDVTTGDIVASGPSGHNATGGFAVTLTGAAEGQPDAVATSFTDATSTYTNQITSTEDKTLAIGGVGYHNNTRFTVASSGEQTERVDTGGSNIGWAGGDYVIDSAGNADFDWDSSLSENAVNVVITVARAILPIEGSLSINAAATLGLIGTVTDASSTLQLDAAATLGLNATVDHEASVNFNGVGTLNLVGEPCLAFPGAEGFGKYTIGGRQGTVYKVTNLNNSGAGSFRAAAETSGARHIIFEISGEIDCLGNDIDIVDDNVSIWGQTSPDPGITVINGTLSLQASQIIIQHMSFRLGVAQSGVDSGQVLGGQSDIIIDHCSFTWDTDGTFDTFLSSGQMNRLTFTNNIYAEHLDTGATGPGGMIITASVGDSVNKTDGITVAKNLFAHCTWRAPLIKGSSHVASVNNVVYNFEEYANWVNNDDGDGDLQIAIVGNDVINGPDSGNSLDICATIKHNVTGEVYINDNLSKDGTDQFDNFAGSGVIVTEPNNTVNLENMTVLAGSAARPYVLANVGSRPGQRDAIDSRIVATVPTSGYDGTEGALLNDEDDVGGFLTIAENTTTHTTPGDYPTLRPSCFDPLEEDIVHPETLIVEAIKVGAITFTATASADFNAIVVHESSVTFSGISNLSLNGDSDTDIITGSISFNGTGTLTKNPVCIYSGNLNISARGTLSISSEMGVVRSGSINFASGYKLIQKPYKSPRRSPVLGPPLKPKIHRMKA